MQRRSVRLSVRVDHAAAQRSYGLASPADSGHCRQGALPRARLARPLLSKLRMAMGVAKVAAVSPRGPSEDETRATVAPSAASLVTSPVEPFSRSDEEAK